MENRHTRRLFRLAATLCLALAAATAVASEADSPEAVATGFVQAWNSHQADNFAALFTDDAAWVPVVEQRLEGRARILADLDQAHTSWAKATTLRASDIAVRPLGRDVAVVLLRAPFLDRDGAPVEPGNALLLVVVRQGAHWRITAGQLTKPGHTRLPR